MSLFEVLLLNSLSKLLRLNFFKSSNFGRSQITVQCIKYVIHSKLTKNQSYGLWSCFTILTFFPVMWTSKMFHRINLCRIGAPYVKRLSMFQPSFFFKVNNGNTRERYEISSKLTIKTPEWRLWRHSGVCPVNF